MKTARFAFALGLATSPLFAHEVAQGPHGGRVAEAGRYHVELVANSVELEAYVTDADERPLDPTGFKAGPSW